MKRGNHDSIGGGGCGGGGGRGGEQTLPAAAAMGKGKAMMEEDDQEEDELLAALGYKVRSSDLADVAQKLKQLEMAMANPDDGLISHLASDTVHYNPSNMSNWLETMLAELNSPPPPLPLPQPRQPINTLALAPTPPSSTITAHIPEPSRKRMRADSSSSSAITTDASSEAPPPLPVVVADPQQAGVRLIHALMACAEAVQAENMSAADALMKQISILAPSQGGAMRKVAVYFAEALARRIYRVGPERDCGLDDALHMHFYESAPYLKFAHFTANQAILEAFAGCRRVHVIDFGMRQGMQWPALMQALALRPCGPPSFRLTGIGPPQPDNTDALQQVGWKLAQFADAIHVDFEYRGFVASSLADLEPYMLESAAGKEPEAVAINSVFELHRLLNRPGALDKVLKTVKAVRPRIVTVVEQEGNHNARQFRERFTEAMHYYSAMFDSMEAPPEQPQPPSQDRVMAEVYMGRQICNVVAFEGAERTERHETLAQWRGRMGSAGFEPVHLGSNAYKQASTLLALFAGGDGYRVEENEGCLTLGWHTRPLIATSAWRAAAS